MNPKWHRGNLGQVFDRRINNSFFAKGRFRFQFGSNPIRSGFVSRSTAFRSSLPGMVEPIDLVLASPVPFVDCRHTF
jgi:hypothetical protein